MSTGWRWMTTWWGAGLAIVTLLLARSLHRVIGKIHRPCDENRSGTLEILSGKDDAKFEIIAVPGLGAHPYHTWEARKPQAPNAAECQTAQSSKIHLLKDLLAHDFPDARIWNFAHDSNWLIDAPVKTTEEIGKCLLKEIKDKRPSPHLPIIFIGHSLGGIIIKQALCTSDCQDIVDDTAGIIFLGAPHQGSSVSIAGAVLAALTGFLGSDTTLLLSLKNHGAQLSNLADAFDSRISPNGRRQRKVPITSFYETKKTYLLGLSLGVVVSRDSAKVHADARESHSIETDHSGLNKCCGPTDALFAALTAAIRRLKTPSLLDQADTWIREKHYTADRLRIERLSGESLSMDQCYINLAIVEQSSQDSGHSKNKRNSAASPFSILARQKVDEPDKTSRVELAALFNERKESDGRPMHPRRIFIRGRAGVGKTTLCKKIVYEFSKGALGKWNELFERVLWVPLRNLKLPERCSMPKYTFEDLFSHEFLLPTNGQDLAGALFRALNTESSKTLFLLDGLDEVSQDLTGDGGMARFLDELLSQPNVVVTSRPSAKSPSNLHLELDTIGFGPEQVNEYIEKSFTNRETAETDQIKVDNVQSFLRERWLIQGLMRIPIQLDALCYTWDDLKPDAILNTMTALYKEIELKLWKKDILRLEKKHEDKTLTQENLAAAGRRKIEGFVKDELAFIESLAFTGLHNDIIDFASDHLDSVSDHFTPNLLPGKSLPSLSFLRTSDHSSEYRDQNYHFIHLTFQEYFAARYFARQWKDQKAQLQFLTFSRKGTEITASSPAELLRKHKYTARYDIFWRFVAGLLDGDGQAPQFINTVEEEPLDLLGPTHQRLVMHCLSEISSRLPIREALEQRLSKWLLFECKFIGTAQFASQTEFPEQALRAALLCSSTDFQEMILRSLRNRASMPPSITGLVVSFFENEHSPIRDAAIQACGGRETLPDHALKAIAARLYDENKNVRRSAFQALGRRATLPDDVLTTMVARLDDKDSEVKCAAIHALGCAVMMPDNMLAAVAGLLHDKDDEVRRAAIHTLGGQTTLLPDILMAVVARLDDMNRQVRCAVVRTIGGMQLLSDDILAAVILRLDAKNEEVQLAAGQALFGCATLPYALLTAVLERLDNRDASVRVASVKALGGRLMQIERVFTALVTRLEDEDKDVRCATVKLLASHPALPCDLLMGLATRLNDSDRDVRNTTVRALSERKTLPDDVVMAIAALFDDNDSTVRSSAVWAISRRETLPDGVVTAVAALLDDTEKDVRQAAIEALRNQSTLPYKVLTAVAERLNDEHIRSTAVHALCSQAALPSEVLAAVVAQLEDKNLFVRDAVIRALGKLATLPDDVLTAIGARVNDEDPWVREIAVVILGERATLPDNALAAIASRLDDEDVYVRGAAVRAISGQATVPEEVLLAVAARLDDVDNAVRGVAEAMIRKHEEFYSNCLHGPRVAALYKILLQKSFNEQLSWYVWGNSTCVNLPDRIISNSIGNQRNNTMAGIDGLRTSNFPPTLGGALINEDLGLNC